MTTPSVKELQTICVSRHTGMHIDDRDPDCSYFHDHYYREGHGLILSVMVIG